jgi:Trk K+ transport system NAD-binding subunit
MRDLSVSADCLVALVVRDGTSTIIPSGDTVPEAGDRVVVVSSEASQAPLRSILCA